MGGGSIGLRSAMESAIGPKQGTNELTLFASATHSRLEGLLPHAHLILSVGRKRVAWAVIGKIGSEAMEIGIGFRQGG